MSLKSIFFKTIHKHICSEAILDYYSDVGSDCRTDMNKHAVEMRGQWYGQGDQCWAFYCKKCGKKVKDSYYIEAMHLINTGNTEIKL